MLPGYSYRNMWWVGHNAHQTFEARGIHGQRIYIDPVAEMVIVKFSSHPSLRMARVTLSLTVRFRRWLII
jgi:CubicO group peptidase (beta-lactamase class C family)